jgi:hypothetical protein
LEQQTSFKILIMRWRRPLLKAIYYVYLGETVAITRDSYNFANYMTKEMEMGPAVAQARSQQDLTNNYTVSH